MASSHELVAQEGPGARSGGWLAGHREQTTNGAFWSASAVYMRGELAFGAKRFVA